MMAVQTKAPLLLPQPLLLKVPVVKVHNDAPPGPVLPEVRVMLPLLRNPRATPPSKSFTPAESPELIVIARLAEVVPMLKL